MNSLESNATLLAAAGSETTASLLSGLTFLLLQHPETLEKLKREVRTSFSNVTDISVASVARLPYLQACIHEGLRRFPPITSNLPRETRERGAFVAGQFVPERVIPFSINFIIWILQMVLLIFPSTRQSSRFSSLP